MRRLKTLSRMDRSTVHTWKQQGVPTDRAARDYLAENVFPALADEWHHAQKVLDEMQGKPEFRYARCTICGLHLGDS